MEKKISVLLLVMIASALGNGIDVRAKVGVTLSQIDRKLKLLNKPAVKSIKSADGDIIDCVDIYKQPAFDHPALKNHTIQMKPSIDLQAEKSDGRTESSRPAIQQTWQKSGSCPKGTIPIRRIRRQDLIRAASVKEFGRKAPQISRGANRTNPKQSQYQPNEPKVQFPPVPNRSVNPKLYGDKLTRLFIYWTRDSYKSTGCFDMVCAGFVQTGQIALGATINPISSDGGAQYYLAIGISKDPNSGNWWLKIDNDKPIGYWPGSLFGYLSQSAILVEWGGQVYSPNVMKHPQHTKTVMGSGSFADTLEGAACSIKHVRIIDYSLQVKYPEWVGTYSDEDYCYGVSNHVEAYPAEPVFYFGGPGQNPNCI
ncbi:Protein of Unknown Function (DUF239) [Melia azedarach]|uniref:Uncharacterized protein n=1 Tax=Melia azedarach TaxID=155640 RepID=A0ACC1XA85_MELAZ|nr:Protein of Unknown Function (DUF239) [Melia azedarach]